MKIFTSTTLTWWQVGALKWAVLFIGIAIGATWPQIFASYTVHLLVLGLLLSVYVGMVWWRQHQVVV